MPGIMAVPNNKANHFGIEVLQGITWQGWEPGKEYTKQLVLKNVRVKTQKLKYSVPGTRFFSTLYPQPITLSAGTSYSLPVTFRPLEKKVYDDEIEFHTKEGIFKIPIKAALPQFEIQIPDLIDMKMCAVQDYVEAIFEVKNNSELQTPFKWELEEPFIIQPRESILEPWTSMTLKATFRPKHAKVYNLTAVCKYGADNAHAKTTMFEGIGKYPHLLVSSIGKHDLDHNHSEALVNFGGVPIRTTVEKWVELHNLSPVNAPFRIEHPAGPNKIDRVFNCSQKNGIVPAMSAIRIPFTYSPHMVNATSIDYYHVVAIGNLSKTVIKCTGSSIGPNVQLNMKSINYFQVDSGTSKLKTFEIINDSDVEGVFQFQIDCSESVFKFSKVNGVIKPKSKETIIVRFEPIHPINYYRQITCLVNNQGPLTLDLIGTCHTELGKPAVLQEKHISRYNVHRERGLTVFPPEQLNEMQKSGKLDLDKSGTLMIKEAEAMEPFCQPAASIPPFDAYFNDGYHSDVVHAVPHVSLDENQLDFGCCDQDNIEQQSIRVTNHTKGKVTIMWMGGPDHTFSVQPQTIDIPPLKSTSFRVSFKPAALNQFYGVELECYAFFKSLCDYRLVEDETQCPPWCMTLNCSGQTFQPNNETFMPRCTVDSSTIVFPAVNVNDAAYRTMTLTNTGTTPILYEFEKDPDGIYSVKPSKGLLSESVQIFVFKCVPNGVKTFKNTMKLKLNSDEKNDKTIKLFGSAEAPSILLDSEGVVYFKPTCIGTNSRREYSFQNTSRIPLRYEWHLKNAESKVITVEPRCGIIQPNETQPQLWTFTPKELAKQVHKPTLIVWGLGMNNQNSGGKKHKFPVRVIGEGLTGDIQADETYVDFGNVIVGSSDSKCFMINNNSNCNLHYKLHVEQKIEGPYPEEQTNSDPCALVLEETHGMLPARSKHMIRGIVKPIRRVFYQFAVTYELLTPEDETASTGPLHLCHVLATGVFPNLAVTDARCAGSATNISKKQLWNLFSIDTFNLCLDADPNPMEVMYSAITRQSHHRRPPVYTRDILDFNFSAAPLNSEPCEVFLKFENAGAVPTEWGFYFPCDLQIELEYWAETGEYDAEELHELKVMDNRLFSIEPKTGKLQPGEHAVVKFTYHHKMSGTDRLPVLLKLARGREIMLNFIGVTVEPDRRYIHFPNNKHMFSPVPVGEKNSPVQVYELYNGGALPVQYEIDDGPEKEIKTTNFDHPVFECMNRSGTILPGRTSAVEWKFSPLEAKTYTMVVPIHIQNGDPAVITFTGIGYDKRSMGETMPIIDQLPNGVPSTQTVPLPGQLAFLSKERVSFGNLPLFSRGRTTIYLSNHSADHTVSFKWHVTVGSDKEVVNLSPSRGILNPRSSEQIKVTFLACTVPSFYDIDLVCEVMDETAMDKFKENIAIWHAEKDRQKVEFTVTETDIDADKRVPITNPEKRPPSGKLKALEDLENAALEGNMTKYSTLPPIKRLTDDTAMELVKEMAKLKQEYWPKPKPPKAFLLHLGVTARTHGIAEFQTNFPNEYNNFHIDRCLSKKISKDVDRQQQQELNESGANIISCTEAEADVLGGIMGNILRGILDDADFHTSVAKISTEPIPYYQQICSVPETVIQTADDVLSGRSQESRQSEDTEPANQFDQQILVSSPSLHEDGEEPELAKLKGPVRFAIEPPTAETTMVSPCEADTPRPSKVSSRQESVQRLQRTDSDIERCLKEERKQKEKEEIKSNPEFSNLIETLLENTLTNIMIEATKTEFNITARPRIIALLPKPGSASSKGSNKS